MAADIVRADLGNGNRILFTVTPTGLNQSLSVPVGGANAAASINRSKSPKGKSEIVPVADLEAVLASVRTFAEKAMDTIKAVAPTKASIEFGVSFGVESGQLTALIVKGTADADVKITLHWDAPK